MSEFPLRVEISYKTVIFSTAVLIGLWFLIQIKEVIILIFLSIILVSALLRPVELLSSKRIPRTLSVLLVYVIIIALVSLIFGIIIPPLISQTSDLISRSPQIISTINDFLIFNKIPMEDLSQIISRQANQIAGNIFSLSTRVFSSIFSIITLFVLTFYLLLEWNYFVKLFASIFSGKQEKKVTVLITKIENGLGNWVRGQLTLSLAVGFLTYIGLLFLGIPYALPLALVAGIFEIIPVVGPIISAIPAILVALSVSPVLALAVTALFFIIQQLENHLIVPVIMSKVVGLQPPIVIVSLLIGAKLAGIGGAFLAVPVIVVLKIAVKEFFTEEKML